MKNKKHLTIGVVTLLCLGVGFFYFFYCNAECSARTMREQTQNFSHIDAVSFKEQLEGGVIIDVRTPEEYVTGHLQGAMLIDFYANDFLLRVGQLDRNLPYYVYCRSGNRSMDVLEKMKTAGFKEVYGLEGGILTWQQAGFPVE